MGRKLDLTGMKFNRLTSVKEMGKDKFGKIQWLFICDCGKEYICCGSQVKSGAIKSCGCYHKEIVSKENKYDLTNEYGIGYDCNGKVFYFDLKDYDLIRGITWNVNKLGYVTGWNADSKKTIKLHRYIMNYYGEKYIDHINHLTFDNRRDNLRICTNQENQFNAKANDKSISGIRGVTYNKNLNKWKSSIKTNGKDIHLGYYDDINIAIDTRLNAERLYWSEEFSYQLNN